MVGYDNQDLEEGRLRWDAITPPECLSLDEMGIAEARQNGACTPYEKEYLHKNGSRIPILIGYAMLEGTVDEFICFVLDLTKQKQSEREAQRYATELERSNRDLEEFAFVASHDLQEPLRKVVRFGARLVERHAGGLDEQGLDYLLRMQAAAERMQHMIRDLLAYARVNSQGRPFEELDLNQLVQEVLSDLDARIQVSGGRIELGELHKLRADPLQMRLLFQNLISNALKFCRPEANPVVQVESRQLPEDILEIRVKDNGIGFDVQKLDFLMQPFQRLHTRNEYEGSGIGLAICRKVVERHGGQISAESTPGKGSTFIVRLPGNSPNPVGEG
jgi:PAS domain S-box-containing protein